jgi:hypothetical protein
MREEIIQAGDTAVRLVLPGSYEAGGGRRYPLLLILDPGLYGGEAVERLHSGGVLPEILVATLQGTGIPPAECLRVICEEFRLLEHPVSRWIAGTGHTAVTAMNVVLDHPEAFGKAACLSTSFEGIEGAPPLHSAILRSLEERPFLPETARIFFDYGTLGLDECYEPYHRDLGAIFRGREWQEGREFQIVRTAGGSHDATSWNARLGPALQWLAAR